MSLRLRFRRRRILWLPLFNAAELTKSRVDVILLLMKDALPRVDGVTYGLVDVQHNRLYDATPQDRLLPE